MSNSIIEGISRDNSADRHISEKMKCRYEEALSQLCLISRINSLVALLDDMPSLCLSLIAAIIEFTPAENCSIMLSDPETGNLRLFVAKGKSDSGSIFGPGMAATVISSGEGAAGWVAENEESVCIDDCEADDRFVDLKSSAKKIGSLISAPIASEHGVMGVINCSHSKKGQFREIDKQNVTLVADHAAVLLQKATAAEQAKTGHRDLKRQLEEKRRACGETEIKFAAIQEQLYRSEKFVTLGELLAGVAHELNNRVAPILIYSQMLQQSVTDAQDIKRLQIIEESAMGAKAILESLLSHSREGSHKKEAVNLNQTLQSTLTLINYKIRNQGIELSVDISPHLPPVKVNEKQMAQVFLNIINNAIHAMKPGDGKLTIRSTFDMENIHIMIADSGPGIPEKLTEKIFDSFFTTKEAGKGTGLGLSISKRYVEENGGRLSVENLPTGGAAFVIEMPTMEMLSEPSRENARFERQSNAPAKILVVDDDSTIRDVIRDVLGPSYNVEFATDGRDATIKIENDPFDLLVVDYHMPGFDGKQLYEWIARNHPYLRNRIIFSTGDIYHETIREFIESTGCGCLVKPFSTANLRETISGALNV